jgi:hypothetical protein
MIKDKYYGCQCWNLDHITHFVYIEEENKNISNSISIIVKTNSLFNEIFHLKYNIFKRLYIVFKYLINPNYNHLFGVFDCCYFCNEDLESINDFLDNFSQNIDILTNHISINNKELKLCFIIDHIDKNCYWVKLELQLLPENIFKRIKHTFKYIFNLYEKEQEFFLNESQTTELKSLIKYVIKKNKEE